MIISKLLEYPTNSNLEHVPVPVVKDSLMIKGIKLPLDPAVNRVVMVEVKGRPGRQSLGFVVLEMKIRFPKDRSV